MKLLLVVMGFLGVLAPSLVSAQPTLVQCGNTIQIVDCAPLDDAGNPVLNPDGSQAEGYRIEGECTFCDFLKMGQNIINFMVYALAIVATLLFMYAGILYLTAAGNQGNISKAHSIFTNVFIGLIIVLAAWLIVDIVLSVLTGKKVGPWTAPICEAVENPCRAKNVDSKEGSIAITDPTVENLCYVRLSGTPPANTEVCTATAQECEAAYAALPAAEKVRGCGPAGSGGSCNNNTHCDTGENNASCPADCPIGKFCYEVNEPAGAPISPVRCCFSEMPQCSASLTTDLARAGSSLASSCQDQSTTAYLMGCPDRVVAGACPYATGGGYSRDDCNACDTALIGQCREEALNADDLASIGINVNKGFCHPNKPFTDSIHRGGCTSLSRLDTNKIADIMDACNAALGGRGCVNDVVITGGSELGHAGENPDHTQCLSATAHCAGKKVDFRHTASMTAFVQPGRNGFVASNCDGRAGGLTHSTTGTCWVNEGDHWDVRL